MQIGITALMSCDFQEQTKDWFTVWRFFEQLKTQKDFSWVISQLKQLYFLFCFGFFFFFGNETNKQTHKQ